MSPRTLLAGSFFSPTEAPFGRQGFRLGGGGAHASRTIMLVELATLFEATAPGATKQDYSHAAVEENCLAKVTAATRRKTLKLLIELYALDYRLPILRVLRRLWPLDPVARPCLALLLALARDPLLRATVPVIIPLSDGEELPRTELRGALRAEVRERLNDSILDKVARNAASSWTQTGHLAGRTFKVRQRVQPTHTSVAYALWLGQASGHRGSGLLSTGWMSVLDCSPSQALELAKEAKRHGLLDLSAAGNVLDLNLARLDPRSLPEAGRSL